MSALTSNPSNTTQLIFSDGIAIPYAVRFWLFFGSTVASLICCLFVLFHFLADSTLRRSTHNHVVIIILVLCLIWEFTAVPWTMYVFRYGVVWIQTPTFCLLWKFLDSTIYTAVAKLVAWSSVERHILVFHHQCFSTAKRRWLAHYLPLGFILIYSLLLYGVITPMYNCERVSYYSAPMCAYYSCMYNSMIFSLYEFLTGAVLCSSLIGFGSVTLMLRVVIQKRRLRRQQLWRKNRKMIIQLLSMTSLFFVFYLPPVVVAIGQRFGITSAATLEYSIYAQFFSDYVFFLFPFACLSTLHQLRKRVKNTLRCHWRRQVHAVT